MSLATHLDLTRGAPEPWVLSVSTHFVLFGGLPVTSQASDFFPTLKIFPFVWVISSNHALLTRSMGNSMSLTSPQAFSSEGPSEASIATSEACITTASTSSTCIASPAFLLLLAMAPLHPPSPTHLPTLILHPGPARGVRVLRPALLLPGIARLALLRVPLVVVLEQFGQLVRILLPHGLVLDVAELLPLARILAVALRHFGPLASLLHPGLRDLDPRARRHGLLHALPASR